MMVTVSSCSSPPSTLIVTAIGAPAVHQLLDRALIGGGADAYRAFGELLAIVAGEAFGLARPFEHGGKVAGQRRGIAGSRALGEVLRGAQRLLGALQPAAPLGL